MVMIGRNIFNHLDWKLHQTYQKMDKHGIISVIFQYISGNLPWWNLGDDWNLIFHWKGLCIYWCSSFFIQK